VHRDQPRSVPAQPEEAPAWVPYLKVAVIVMGVLIVLGLIGLGYMFYARSQKQAAEEAAAITLMPDPATGAATTEQDAGIPSPVSLGLPRGSRVTQMSATDDRLVLNIRVPTEGERIVIIDLRKGRVIGHVALEDREP
jgi:hypothetical protein